MAQIDADAPAGLSELIQRAGWALAHHARLMLAGTYGKRVLVLTGPGNNGADGKVAAAVLERWGVRCEIMAIPLESDRGRDRSLRATPDLVIDAAFGTGFRGEFTPPPLPTAPVLAADIPSGIDGLTGVASGLPLKAQRTVTFGAVKPGLLLNDGPDFCGEVLIETLGLDCSRTSLGWLDSSDVNNFWPTRPRDTHKWAQAVWVIGGSPGMSGAVTLCAEAAFRAGAGAVSVSIPGDKPPHTPTEAVGRELGADWGPGVVAEAHRYGAIAIGPGMGAAIPSTQTLQVIADSPIPVVVDAGGLSAIARFPEVVRKRSLPTVLTPHDGEYEQLMGRRPGSDRLSAAAAASAHFDCVVLLKGPTTIVADPSGQQLMSTAGDQRLATAGSGDVLTGVIAAGLAGGLDARSAAGLGAELHGLAAGAAPKTGLVAGDLPQFIGLLRN